jgi:hypothetical protein
MATTTKYLWPPNFDGNPPEPGQPGWTRIKVQITNANTDGTDESLVKKIDITEAGGLRRSDGQPVVRTALEEIHYDAFGFTNIQLFWDREPAETMAVLAGNNSGHLDYRKSGGLAEVSDGLNDGTGNILLSTTGATAGDSYTIILHLLLM